MIESTPSLHFRVFDAEGGMVVDAEEGILAAKRTQIEELRAQLENMWLPTN